MLLERDAASMGHRISTFRGNVVASSSRVETSTKKFSSRNVGNRLLIVATLYPRTESSECKCLEMGARCSF